MASLYPSLARGRAHTLVGEAVRAGEEAAGGQVGVRPQGQEGGWRAGCGSSLAPAPAPPAPPAQAQG